MVHERLINELRRKYPGLSGRCDGGSPMASIRLFCLECMGGRSLDVSNCAADVCPLYLLRLGHRPGNVSDPIVDSGSDDLEALSDDCGTDGLNQPENGAG